MTNNILLIFFARFSIKILFSYSSLLEFPLFKILLFLIFLLLLLRFPNRGIIHRGTRSPKEFFGLFILFMFNFGVNLFLFWYQFERRSSFIRTRQ